MYYILNINEEQIELMDMYTTYSVHNTLTMYFTTKNVYFVMLQTTINIITPDLRK